MYVIIVKDEFDHYEVQIYKIFTFFMSNGWDLVLDLESDPDFSGSGSHIANKFWIRPDGDSPRYLRVRTRVKSQNANPVGFHKDPYYEG